MTVSGGEVVLFWVLAPLMVLAALGLLFARKAVHAAICVVFVMISLAILYIAQEAAFLGVVQIVVYTGAVMMLFLFVLMLVGVDASDSLVETIRGQRAIGVLLGLGLGSILVGVIAQATFPPSVGLTAANAESNPVALARILFADYVFALEVVGILLVTAAIAALVLTHRRRLVPRVGQRQISDAKVAALAEGGLLTPLPAPGVYAQNNAMDTPALDPQGRPIEHSVSRILRIRGQERSAGHILARERAVLAEHEPELTARRFPELTAPTDEEAAADLSGEVPTTGSTTGPTIEPGKES
ncbi:NADH-quinone oxidoreductase subunit J [Oerskovia turbata]|uniref:NADH-quinone oxidoreductase subunit J n=2 Tax=Oerskovia turbata TaxID=1713 RepID=A0A4Q1KUM1_9CELL|nr:NADH-quinone oxidoreductase subunit J [Oerskovia turbata]RXR23574.1 NADH-quinone oxidoreductase subunit J [Oerskovia turbata]RXR32844.1 NADH-quinone oxidoreductase subunit J [Oerskovia turbata]TGJ95149.1 NADH-quinone oxidoreductase subunit J [Actinotalea fermentans ATCC 43279 = JCM 9966 = DSM 3133]